jgi:hypothetical protein
MRKLFLVEGRKCLITLVLALLFNNIKIGQSLKATNDDTSVPIPTMNGALPPRHLLREFWHKGGIFLSKIEGFLYGTFNCVKLLFDIRPSAKLL